jgi:predicted phosphoadenosine phosphosulfate sulfurtransferase
MSKLKEYIDANVYEEAKKRIVHVINTFDKIFVSFSGGKDSLVVLELVEEVFKELGIKEKVNVIFRDEELIPDDVIQFVQEKYESGRYNFKYYAVPMRSSKFVLGETFEYIQWDNSREWIREKPDYAIKGEKGKVYDQYSMDAMMVGSERGKIALLTGIRADESLVRFRSCINKKNENYINATEIKNVKLVKPIFDWAENDVFKYFYDNGIKYCGIYDLQMFNGESLRVSTPLHAEAAKRFGKIKTIYPQFYAQLVDMFPEMILQDRYWNEYDRYAVMKNYELSWKGLMRFINDHITDKAQNKLAKERFFQVKTYSENGLKKDRGGGYPIDYVFKCFVNGNYKRKIQPLSKQGRKTSEV